MSTKKLLFRGITAAAIIFGASAQAEWSNTSLSNASGAYIGIQGGYAETNWSKSESFLNEVGYNTADISDGTYGGRAFLGYDFNDHFGAEVGYAYLRKDINYTFSGNGSAREGSIGYQAYDALLKMRVCLDNGFDVYTKLGVAYLGSYGGYTLAFPSRRSDPSYTNVTFGAGFGYSLTPNWITNLDWQYYRGQNDSLSYLADVNMFSLGIAYKFAC